MSHWAVGSHFTDAFENLPFEQKENEGRQTSLKKSVGMGGLGKLSTRLRVVFTKKDSHVWELMVFIVWGALEGLGCASQVQADELSFTFL